MEPSTPPASRSAPAGRHSAALEEVEDEAQDPLNVNMKTADLDELDELPEVGAVTAETMVEYRRTNGMFRSVEELASMRNRKTSELRFRALLPRGASEVELTLA